MANLFEHSQLVYAYARADAISLDPDYKQPVFLEGWSLPARAFRENAGLS